MKNENIYKEEILIPDPNRYVLFPIIHDEIWEFYKKAQYSFWTAEEIDLSLDVNDFKSLNKDEQHFIKYVLAFFASADGIVNENLVQNFYTEVQYAEAKAFYAVQINIETIHSEVYSLMIDTYIRDKHEKEHLFQSIQHFPCIKAKAEWALKWLNTEQNSFAERLLAFAIVEGVFFSGSFCAIYWLKKRNLMPGLCTANEFISRDEGLHCNFAVLLYSMLSDKLTESQVHSIFAEAIEIEEEFITESLPVSLIGMNKQEMKSYIKFVADRLLVSLNYNKLYYTDNPFQFMDLINLEGKTNFFEKRVAEYALSTHDRKFELNCDF